MGGILLSLSPVFRTYKRGKTVKSNTYVLILSPLQQEVLHKEASFYAFFLPPHEGRSILLPNVILWGWSFCFLSHSWPVRRCKSDMSLDPALTLHWQSKKCPPSPLGLACDAVVLLSPRLSPARASSLVQLLLSPLVAHEDCFLVWQSSDRVKSITFRRKITGDNTYTHLLSMFSAKVSEIQNFNSFTKRCAVAMVRLIYNPRSLI